MFSFYFLEYLAVFCHLIAFHDPELFIHLNETGFQPEVRFTDKLIYYYSILRKGY